MVVCCVCALFNHVDTSQLSKHSSQSLCSICKSEQNWCFIITETWVNNHPKSPVCFQFTSLTFELRCGNAQKTNYTRGCFLNSKYLFCWSYILVFTQIINRSQQRRTEKEVYRILSGYGWAINVLKRKFCLYLTKWRFHFVTLVIHDFLLHLTEHNTYWTYTAEVGERFWPQRILFPLH